MQSARPFLPVQYVRTIATDFLTPEPSTKAISPRHQFDAYFSGNNERRRDKREGRQMVAKKPLIPAWLNDEETMIGWSVDQSGLQI